MPLEAGTKLGPYEILSPLGAGGMGEVYKARDTRLDRTVAVKVTSGAFSERFDREARAVAALNHPHICTLHDVGPNYLVMEYLEGETLASRIARGPVPFAEAMKLALEMADALVAAHTKGITHRDIKPSNVMIVKSGSKLLDFGLARMERPIVTASDETRTMAAMTTPGTILGTFQYMAPEQLEGKEADARSDIFSFAVVLYEMVTGRKAFQGKTQVSLMAAILEHEPEPVSALQKAVPAELDRFITVCLSKNPDERFQSAKDVLRELKWVAERPATPPVPVQIAAPEASPWHPNRWAYVAAFSGLLAISASLARFFEAPRPPLPQVRFNVILPEGVTVGSVPRITISPDGTQVAFNATSNGKEQMWVRPLNSTEARLLPGTEGSQIPFWSADSKSIGFFADGKLKRIDVSGGPVQILCDAPVTNTNGAWSPNGSTIIFSGRNPDTPVSRVSSSGGVPAPVPGLDAKQIQGWPRFLPDGKHFLFLVGAEISDSTGVYVGSLDGAPPKRILASAGHAEYASGHLLYLLDETLMARPFDADALEFTGDAVPLAASVARLANGRVAFSVSSNGNLILAAARQGSAVNRLVWMDRAGKATPLDVEPGDYFDLSLSRDGKQLAMSRRAGGASDVWLLDLARLVPSRITFDDASDNAPVWSPDGRTVVFTSTRGGSSALYRKAGSGLGEEELLVKLNGSVVSTDWSSDGKFLLFHGNSAGSPDLYVLPMLEKVAPVAVQAEPRFVEERGRFSPDGKWIAFSTNESGPFEVSVRSFPGNERKIQISTGGGTQPRWRPDGRELYYISGEGMLMAVPVKSWSPFEPGTPVPLFPKPGFNGSDGGSYVPANDGSRFLVIQPLSASQAIPLTVIQNWPAALRK